MDQGRESSSPNHTCTHANTCKPTYLTGGRRCVPLPVVLTCTPIGAHQSIPLIAREGGSAANGSAREQQLAILWWGYGGAQNWGRNYFHQRCFIFNCD